MEDLKIQIADINGHTVIYDNLNQMEIEDLITIQLGQLPPGIYFVSLLSKSEKLDTEKFIIK